MSDRILPLELQTLSLSRFGSQMLFAEYGVWRVGDRVP
jgi:hypothetical protein